MRTCKGCGIPEERRRDSNGRPTVNLDPTTDLCTACTVKASTARFQFHSRREDRLGEVVDTKQLQAGKDAD